MWKLKANGAESILIGTQHRCIEFEPRQFTPLLEGKKYLLSEVPVASKPDNHCIMLGYGMDEAVYRAACELGIPCVELEEAPELWEHKNVYRLITASKLLKCASLAASVDDAVLSGDIGRVIQLARLGLDGCREQDLRALRQSITQRNERMVGRAMPHLLEGCVITTGIMHAIGDNNVLRMYEARGIEIERI